MTRARAASYAASAIVSGFLVALVLVFAWESRAFWAAEGSGALLGTRWFYRQGEFGAASMIYGTLVVSAVALLGATPLGVGAALFTAEILPERSRLVAKGTIELLAGIPSVVYGLLGVLFLRDWVYRATERFEPLSGDTLLTAGVLLGIMVLPTVMTFSDDALRSVPAAQREAARSLGLTRTEVVFAVSLPRAAPGIVAALLLALGRALGETIAVFLVIGRRDNRWPESLFSLRPLLEAGQTLTSKLGGSETNIAYGDPIHWGAMVALGLVLLLLVSTMTVAGARLALRRG